MWRRVFTYIYMCRVPLLVLLTLGVFLPAAFHTPMLHGIADLQNNQIALVSLAAFLLLSTSMTCIFLVLLYGSERVDGLRAPYDPVRTASALPTRLPASSWVVAGLYVAGFWLYLRFLYAVLQTMKSARLQTGELSALFWERAVLGFLIGAVIVFGVFVTELALASVREAPQVAVFALPFAYIAHNWNWLKERLNRVSRLQPVRALQSGGALARDNLFFRIFVRTLGPGYGKFDADGKPIEANPGHFFAALLAFACFLLYWIAGWHTHGKLISNAPFAAARPYDAVLLQVLLLLLLACWVLAALSFFFDRFRVPFLVPLALILLGTSYLGPSDHTFHVLPSAAVPALLPTPAARFAEAPDHVILVAAAGGGIQSAAWTSEVLCGLRKEIGPSFDHSVLAVSGVSGGSVGLMFYLKCLESPPGDMTGAMEGEKSSLEAIAWGLAHPDLVRTALPVPWSIPGLSWPGADRGWALERALRKNAQFSPQNRPLEDTDLQKNWPAVLINSTEVRTGDPVVFANTDFPVPSDPNDWNHSLHGFHLLYAHTDVLLETAVRMSAAFPYVSPAARPDTPPNGEHLVDGGYFGNSGLFSLGQWIEDAAPRLSRKQFAEAKTSPRKKILLLHIDAFPDSQWKGPADSPHRWFYQLAAPILAILHVRAEGQLVRDEASDDDLLELLERRGYDASGLVARYSPTPALSSPSGAGSLNCPGDPPLTWHLTQVEQQCIQQFWAESKGDLVPAIRDFLAEPIAEPPEQPRKVTLKKLRRGIYRQNFEQK